jgi:hypothetical protein
MKLREGFILRDVAGNSFVVATGALSAEFHGMITLNETGKFIWKMLEKGAEKDEIIEALCAEYEVDDKNIVVADVDAFIEKLEKDNIIE